MKPCNSRLKIPQIIILHELWPLLQLQSVFERKTKIYDISISTRHFNKVMCQKITSTQKTLKREQGETWKDILEDCLRQIFHGTSRDKFYKYSNSDNRRDSKNALERLITC